MRKRGSTASGSRADKILASILGHYSAGFTLDTYTHTTSDMQKVAANKVGCFIAQAV